MFIAELPSPNHNTRRPVAASTAPRHVVIHYTGMPSRDAALQRLCDPAAQVSAHYFIDQEGAVFRLVAEEQRAWHAGVSFWRGVTDLNSTSIGIELCNPGHEWGYRPYPAPQISALIALLADIVRRHRLPATSLVGHSDIAPSRKVDPGELFPWRTLARAGLGLWPEPSTSVRDPVQLDQALQHLFSIGYAVPFTAETGAAILDPRSAVPDVLRAFQRRFMPSDITGVLDESTGARILEVAQAFAQADGSACESAGQA